MKAKAKSEETRGLILDTALGLFRKNGFEETTMREIASEARVALGSAYYYYDSKHALVMAFYERAQREMEPEIRARLSRSQCPCRVARLQIAESWPAQYGSRTRSQ